VDIYWQQIGKISRKDT